MKAEPPHGVVAKNAKKEITMKITKRQLKQIIKEEKALLMEEPSDYYKDYRAGLITRQEYEALVRQYNERESSYSYRPRQPRKTKKVGLEATRDRLDVIRRVRAKKDNKFLLSISNQLSMGRDLTSKQNAIVRKIVAKHEPESASLFESKTMTEMPSRPTHPRDAADLAFDTLLHIKSLVMSTAAQTDPQQALDLIADAIKGYGRQ